MKHTRDLFFDAVENMFGNSTTFTKNAEIIKNDDGFEISLILPGFLKQEVEISVEGDNLYINAKTDRNLPCYLPKKVSRAFTLNEIDPESINASLENGILTVKFSAVKKLPSKKVIVL